MRARGLKPGIFKNELLGTADPLFTIFFEGLWCMADREGRLEDRPLRLKAEIFPYRDVKIDELLSWLTEKEFITRYEVNGYKYILINNFTKHQNPHKKEAPSVVPDFPGRASEIPALARLTPDSGLSGFERDTSVDVLEIGYAHPKNSHLAKHNRQLPYSQEHAIAEAIMRDGRDLVLAGTRNFAERVATWPPGELRFAPDPVKFFTESQYLKDPVVWERSQPQGQAAKHDQDTAERIREFKAKMESLSASRRAEDAADLAAAKHAGGEESQCPAR